MTGAPSLLAIPGYTWRPLGPGDAEALQALAQACAPVDRATFPGTSGVV